MELIVFPSITAAVGIVTAAYMERLNGSVTTVLSFFMTNPSAVATWTFTSLLIGVTIGAFVTICIKNRELKGLEQRHEAELAALRKPRKPEETPEQKHERMLKAACADINGLSKYGTLMLCDLLEIDEAVVVEFDEREPFIHAIPSRLLEIKPTRSGKFSIRASELAREAAPLVFAKE